MTADDLLDGGWIGGIATALVARRSAGWKPGIVAGDRRRPGGIERNVGHDTP
jgi:hypothetical protein